MKKYFLIAIIPALLFQFIGALFYFVIFPGGTVTKIIYSLTKILLIVWPLLWLSQTNIKFTLRPTSRAIYSGVLSGCIGGAVILSIFFLFQTYFNGFASAVMEKTAALDLTSPALFILFALFLSLLHSLLEEYYWRWYVFTGLCKKFSPTTAGLIGSIAFASHHYIILSQFLPPLLTILFGTAVGIAGAYWCYLYKKTNTLISSWISHAMIDMAIMYIGYILIFQS